MKNVFLKTSLVLALFALTGCGGGDSDFSGTFVGNEYVQGQTARVSLVLTANGKSFSGTFSSSSQQGGQTVSGTVMGTTQGNTITQMTVNASGGFCPTMTGTGTQTNRTIIGTLTCLNSGQPGGQGSQANQFQVTRQQ